MTAEEQVRQAIAEDDADWKRRLAPEPETPDAAIPPTPGVEASFPDAIASAQKRCVVGAYSFFGPYANSASAGMYIFGKGTTPVGVFAYNVGPNLGYGIGGVAGTGNGIVGEFGELYSDGTFGARGQYLDCSSLYGYTGGTMLPPVMVFNGNFSVLPFINS